MPHTSLETTDTDFASALMAKGAKLTSWCPLEDTGRTRLKWRLDEVDPKWVDEYRAGTDHFSAFVHARKMLVNIAKTDSRIAK